MELNKKIKFKVDGMHCGGCASKIKNKFQEINSNHQVEIDLPQKTVILQFNGTQNSAQEYKAGIIECGFQVESLEIIA